MISSASASSSGSQNRGVLSPVTFASRGSALRTSRSRSTCPVKARFQTSRLRSA